MSTKENTPVTQLGAEETLASVAKIFGAHRMRAGVKYTPEQQAIVAVAQTITQETVDTDTKQSATPETNTPQFRSDSLQAWQIPWRVRVLPSMEVVSTLELKKQKRAEDQKWGKTMLYFAGATIIGSALLITTCGPQKNLTQPTQIFRSDDGKVADPQGLWEFRQRSK